jgi:anti-anti-sigma factor
VQRDESDGAQDFCAEVIDVDGESVVVVRGEVDMSVVDRLRSCVTHVTKRGRPLVLDVADVTFMDSSGVNFLMQVHEEHGAVVLRRPSPSVLRVLELAGVDGYITVEP